MASKMDIKDLFQFQLISQMGAHSSTGPPRSMMHVFQQMLIMALISFLSDIIRAVPIVIETMKTNVTTYFKGRIKERVESVCKESLNDVAVGLNTKHFENRVLLTRVFKLNGEASSGQSNNNDSSSGSEVTNDMVDAILAQVSRLANVPSFQLIDRGQAMITYKDKPIQMSRDVFFKIKHLEISPEGAVLSVKFELLSNSFSACDIVNYINTLYTNYLNELKNSLGNNIYFFEQKHREGAALPPPPNNDPATLQNHKRMLISTAPKQLSFTHTPFYSNKKFSNIFGDEARLIEKRVRFFIDNKSWYDDKGVPYHLGILLSGIPGSGKSSCIKAIANMTKRHIINVNFANITTATQLKQLFYSERIQVYTDNTMSNMQSLFIPIDQRIYVLEEIDAIGNIVKERSLMDPNTETQPVPDELTLMEILTILDGTMEIPGRIVVMTTNHPETLDKALVRPGRIDVQVSFGNAKRATIKQMFESFMNMSFPSDKEHMLPDKAMSPAEVAQVLFRHFDTNDVDGFIRDLAVSAARSNVNTVKSKETVLQYVKPENEKPSEGPAQHNVQVKKDGAPDACSVSSEKPATPHKKVYKDDGMRSIHKEKPYSLEAFKKTASEVLQETFKEKASKILENSPMFSNDTGCGYAGIPGSEAFDVDLQGYISEVNALVLPPVPNSVPCR